MDSIISSPGSRKLHRKDVGDREDIFSKLPDSVLHYILSFLSTKEAIRTSILARRRKLLWTYLCDYDIEYLSSTDKKENQNQIEKCLLSLVDTLLHKACHIKRFRFVAYGVMIDADQAHSWISAALKHKVEHLDLSLDIRTSFVLANSFSAPESLNYLNLELGCVLNIPSCIRFPGLKTLTLSCLTFLDETSAQQLFSGCPVLQKLTLYNCVWKNIENVSIKLPTIRTLVISQDPNSDELFNCKVTIDAVNLVSFSCTSQLALDLALINLPSLVDAYLEVSNRRLSLEQFAVPRAIKVLSGICHAKSLILAANTLEYISFAEDLLSVLPTFHNLTNINVCGMFEFTSKALLDILEKSPNLEVLQINLGLYGKEWTFNSVPHCFKSSLKSFIISNFEGCPTDMKLLNFLLENATILREITIFCEERLSADSEKQAEISNQLQIVRRGLANCVINIQ
ncbi:putative F-box domain, FBD domain, leucine-rich repeat domain, L domain-containing protein [Senna tora]|uniref:Putative F-box domain, FBD domain, leucine-rich repeat domain, L domain-containing protein n=1 Tax=Senna tora TaxID=362788 RepID=A0A834TL81_9FABA|nr:putative F-box domain, FBD domain, leucine-rich repeat domain, L domain-containing protein [Senna tora]